MARLSPPTAEWAVDGPIWHVSADRLVRSRRGSVGRRSGHAGAARDRVPPPAETPRFLLSRFPRHVGPRGPIGERTALVVSGSLVPEGKTDSEPRQRVDRVDAVSGSRAVRPSSVR